MKSSTLIGGAIAALAITTSFAQAAQVVVTNPNLPIHRTIALACSAGHGDVGQTIYITNSTGQTIAAGTKVYWTLNGAKGSFVLQAALKNGKTVSDLAGPGNGGPCNASYYA